ncbi:MAG: ATPase [Candidatus Krumholzibacteriota bacterium]|nr:ATPase [Candidatus Krumholzibacteriota bacterium]
MKETLSSLIQTEKKLKLADCGSTWTKILDVESDFLEIITTRELVRKDLPLFDIATGHSAKKRCAKFKNELLALAEGALSLVDKEDFSIVDVGGRDVKFIRFKGRKVKKIDWNLACGATTGATIELLTNYYQIDYPSLEPVDTWINVTCGVFGMERVLESVSKGKSPQRSVAEFIHGMVRNVFDFTQRPSEIYLSGGFCGNRCFLDSMARYSKVIPLGRAVLIEGLKEETAG